MGRMPVDSSALGPPAGLWSALSLDGKGGAAELDWQGIERWRPEQGQLWVHIDPSHPEALGWLRERSQLSTTVFHELLRDDLQPRIEDFGDGVLIASLRGLGPDLELTSANRTELHVWVDPTRLISLCERSLPGAHRAQRQYSAGQGPTDLSALLVSMTAGLALSMRQHAIQLEAPVAELEYKAETKRGDTSATLRELRGCVTGLRRILAPFKVVVDRTVMLKDSWIVRDRPRDWQRLADDVQDTDVLLQSLNDRLAAVHDYVGECLARTMNAVLYRLTIFSTILLPLTVITGLLGMNVGVAGASYRFMDNSSAFILVTLLLGLLAWLEYRFLRKRHLLPKHDEPDGSRRLPHGPPGTSKSEC
jgi:zinc transporter